MFKHFKNRKIEFSKAFCGLIAGIIGLLAIYAIIRYYALVKLAILNESTVAPDVTLAVTCVSVVLGAVLSYCLYQFGLKNSRNKYGIDENGEPYKKEADENDTEYDN